MNVENMDKMERLINKCRKYEEEIKNLNKILESPHKLPFGYADYGTYSFASLSGVSFTYELNMEDYDIEALRDWRLDEIENLKRQMEEL